MQRCNAERTITAHRGWRVSTVAAPTLVLVVAPVRLDNTAKLLTTSPFVQKVRKVHDFAWIVYWNNLIK